VRILAFLLVSGLAHFLAARWLLSTFPEAQRVKRRRLVLGIASVLSLLLAFGRILASVHETPATRLAIALAMLELAAVTIALVPIGLLVLSMRVVAKVAPPKEAPAPKEEKAEKPAATDPITRRQAIERVAGVSLFGATTVALGWGMVRGRHAYEMEEVVVRVKGWPRTLEGYVIAQVSDVHVGAFIGDRELDEGFELVQRIKPDLMVATGDLVDFESDAIGPLVTRLLRAGARDGAYAILGNHDHYAGAADVARRLRITDVRVLCNEATRLRTGDSGGFALIGLDDLQGRARPAAGFAGPDLSMATRDLLPDVPRILLAHQPKFLHESAGRVALQLSGHTHGGQINPGFRPADLIMEYVSGRYERDGTTLWVNRGFGVAGPPSRLGAPPEVTKIVIIGA
jgi:predicted MPP superfamily phosphohydrolase